MDTIRGKFLKQHLLSDEFLDLIEKNKRPMDELMSYYQCAIMEVETKFKVLNQEYSLEYDRNPIEGIKTRVKSYDSILRKIRRKNIPMTLEGIEENIRDIAGVRVHELVLEAGAASIDNQNVHTSIHSCISFFDHSCYYIT